MLDPALCRSAQLPKGWPRSVRSSVIRVVSLDHLSLTSARAVAAKNLNARLRLKAENDRLGREVSFLTQALGINDARMLRIPLHEQFAAA